MTTLFPTMSNLVYPEAFGAIKLLSGRGLTEWSGKPAAKRMRSSQAPFVLTLFLKQGCGLEKSIYSSDQLTPPGLSGALSHSLKNC
jgi:hypothetical protein